MARKLLPTRKQVCSSTGAPCWREHRPRGWGASFLTLSHFSPRRRCSGWGATSIPRRRCSGEGARTCGCWSAVDKPASMTIRVPLVLGFHCQYCIAQVKQNMHKYKVQLLDLHEGQVYYEMWQLNLPTNIYKSSNNKKYQQISTNLPTI